MAPETALDESGKNQKSPCVGHIAAKDSYSPRLEAQTQIIDGLQGRFSLVTNPCLCRKMDIHAYSQREGGSALTT
jgi:hypothetical protein